MNCRNVNHGYLKENNRFVSVPRRTHRTRRRNRKCAVERIISRCFVFRCLDFCCMPNPGNLDSDDDDYEDAEGTEVERTVVRYMPESLEKLLSITGFDKYELKTLYRNFKNECPTGVATEEKFKSIYCQFFPHGDADMYAHYVFRAFDQQEEGYVNFEEFAIGLSSLLRGSLADRLHWTFRLYDINHNGYITKEEMTDILKSIYLLMGKYVEPAITEDSYMIHAEKIFTQLDQNQDGIVTMDEFCETCSKDASIIQSMSIFDKAM